MAPQPSQKVSLNLDTIEREDAKEPFAVVVNGKRLEFKDAAEVEWKTLRDMDTPEDFFEECLTGEDRTYLYEQELPGWKFKLLWEGYQKHYGMLEDKGNSRA